MPRREPPTPSPRWLLPAGTITFDELVDFLVLGFDSSSLSADHAIELLFLVDYIRAELCAVHHDTFQALCGGGLEPGAIF